MTLTVEIDQARRTAAFREVSFLAAGDSCRVVLDGVRGADFGSLALLLYRDAASESPVASCSSFSAVPNHPSLADGELALDTSEMAAWFEDAVPDDSDDSELTRPSASVEPRLAARASLAERSVRADGWLVVLDRGRTWAACRVPVLLRPGAGGHGASDPTSVRALVEGLVSAAMSAAMEGKRGLLDMNVYGTAWKGGPEGGQTYFFSLKLEGLWATSDDPATAIRLTWEAFWTLEVPGVGSYYDTESGGDADSLVFEHDGLPSWRLARVPDASVVADTLAKVSQIPAAQVNADWNATGGVAQILNKPTIPAPVSVDATLATPGAAADAKAVGDALRGGFTEWVCEPPTYNGRDVEVKAFENQMLMRYWRLQYVSGGEVIAYILMNVDDDRLELYFEDVGVTATRHLITPTKTSQLTNDGDGTSAFVKTNDTRLSDARTPTAHHATHAAGGSDPLAPADIGAAASADLPYRQVEPGKWEFSPPTYQGQTLELDWRNGTWAVLVDGTEFGVYPTGDENALELSFTMDVRYTATRASLPGHLCDRAGNRVVVTGDTTLTLPALEHAGRLRDFLVRLEISGSTVPTITFAAPTGETITYETDGDEFPVPDEAGMWGYSFTENCVAHKFAVSLKKVNEVAAPQAQGGS